MSTTVRRAKKLTKFGLIPVETDDESDLWGRRVTRGSGPVFGLVRTDTTT